MSEPDFGVNDAVVSYSDAHQWANELLPAPTGTLINPLLEEEPALVVIALNLSERAAKAAIKAGLTQEAASRLASYVLRCGLITALMTRRGYRKLIADLEQLPEPEPEDGHES